MGWAPVNLLEEKTLIVVGGILLVSVGAAWAIKKAGGAIGGAAGAVADTAGGIVSGNNAITQAARTDAYQGAGVVGTIAASADIASGGILSKAGEYIGGKLADWTLPDPLATITPASRQNERSATSGGSRGFY